MLTLSTFESSNEIKSSKKATMKKIVSSLLLFGTFAWSNAQGFAQNKYEGLLKTALAVPSDNNTTNMYFRVTREEILDKWITSIQKEVANYTFISTAEHEADEIYKVIFGTENSSIVANYNGNGELMATYETYDLRHVPLHFKNTIQEKFSSVEIQNCRYKVTYKKNEEPIKRFFIQINSEGKSHNIKLDMNGNLL